MPKQPKQILLLLLRPVLHLLLHLWFLKTLLREVLLLLLQVRQPQVAHLGQQLQKLPRLRLVLLLL